MTLAVATYIFDQVEVLDFAGPYEVFTTAARVRGRMEPQASPPFAVVTVGRTPEPVRARAGLPVQPDDTFDDHPTVDLLVVPGGVVSAELARPEVAAWIAAQSTRTQLTASVCTGACLLAQADLLTGRPATTHREDIADVRAVFPAVAVQAGLRWVDAVPVVTSAGISAGIDLSLHLVGRLAGRELAVATARQMQFDWTETPVLHMEGSPCN